MGVRFATSGRLAKSLMNQNRGGACEWVILDNGCSQAGLVAYLKELGQFSWVKLKNLRRMPESFGVCGTAWSGHPAVTCFRWMLTITSTPMHSK